MLIVDGHLDLAYNALNFGRNLSLPVADIRASEAQKPPPVGINTVSVPALLEGGVRLVFGSLFVMPASRQRVFYGSKIVYNDGLPEPQQQREAHEIAMRQRDIYQRLADEDDRVLLVNTQADLKTVLEGDQLGIIISMEGAQPIREPEEVELWYEQGLRSVGLAWDDSRYAPGQWTGARGLTNDGFRLLERMADLRMIADITHMEQTATFQVLEQYDGPVVASHNNARHFIDASRHLSDAQIRTIAERDGLIGVVLFNLFLRDGHKMGDPRELVTIERVVAQIDYICQLIGDAAHVGIGSDWDGGFGLADIPHGLDSAADLPKVATALTQYGYSEDDVVNIMGGNWLRIIGQALPT